MPPLEGDKEVKLGPEETIAERVKFIPRKRKNEEKIKNLAFKQTIN